MNILFVCTHNRCRSILAEAIANHLGTGKVRAASAGSQPAGVVHPLTLKYLEEEGIAIDALTSQSWDEYADSDIDVVITVCDSAAGETCPLWMGNSIRVHWGLPDPSKIEGPEEEVSAAFKGVIRTLERRIEAILREPIEDFSPEDLGKFLQDLEKY